MTAVRANLTIRQGGTFTQVFEWKDSAGAAVDNSAYSARLKIKLSKDAATEEVELTSAGGDITLGGADGLVTVTMTAAATEALTWDEAYYDLELVNGAVVEPFTFGRVNITKEITD